MYHSSFVTARSSQHALSLRTKPAMPRQQRILKTEWNLAAVHCKYCARRYTPSQVNTMQMSLPAARPNNPKRKLADRHRPPPPPPKKAALASTPSAQPATAGPEALARALRELRKESKHRLVVAQPSRSPENCSSATLPVCRNIWESFGEAFKIGQGAYGIVYRASERLSNGRTRTVALKQVHANGAQCKYGGFPHSMIREMQLMQRTSHPHVIQLLEVAVNKANDAFLVLEYCDFDLQGLRHRVGQVPTCVAREWTAQLLQGLAHCHSLGIIHRYVLATTHRARSEAWL